MSKERYNEIIDITYQEYNELFNSYYPPFSAPYPKRLTKEEFIDEIKRGDELTKEYLLDISIEDRGLSTEERNQWFQINLNGNNPLMKSDWKDFELDQQNIPKRVITLTYKNEKIKIYE